MVGICLCFFFCVSVFFFGGGGGVNGTCIGVTTAIVRTCVYKLAEHYLSTAPLCRALTHKSHDDDRQQMFKAYDRNQDGFLNTDDVSAMLKAARVGADGTRHIWAKNVIHAFDILEPHDSLVSFKELNAVTTTVGWDTTGKACRQAADAGKFE